MQKDDLVKLAEALASAGYKILSFNWDEAPYEYPHIETVELKIQKRISKNEMLNPVS
jgi:hypothetical protein